MDILNFNTWLKDQWEKPLLVPKETRDYLTWESSENIRPEPSSFGITSKTWQQEEIVVHVYRNASKTRWWNPPKKKKCLTKWGMLGRCRSYNLQYLQSRLDEINVMPSSVRFLSVSRGGCDAQKKTHQKKPGTIESSSKRMDRIFSPRLVFRGKPPVNTKNLIQKSRILQ